MRRVVSVIAGIVALQLGIYKYIKHLAVDSDGASISHVLVLARARRKMVTIAERGASAFQFKTHAPRRLVSIQYVTESNRP